MVSFHTTTEAIAMRNTARANGLKGRLIPIPRKLSAGCGLAWSEPGDDEAALLQMMQDCHLEYEAMATLTH